MSLPAPLALDVLSGTLAEMLEEALLSPSRAPLEAMHSQLAELYMQAFAAAPDAVRKAIRSPDVGPGSSNPELLAIQAALRLGELKFAHLMAAQVERRASDDFVPLATTGLTGRIALLLMTEDLEMQAIVDRLLAPLSRIVRNVALQEAKSTLPSAVAGAVRRMIDEGILEFRRNALGNVEYFLTHAGQAVLRKEIVESPSEEKSKT